MTARAAISLAALAAAGCTWGEPPAMAITSVSTASPLEWGVKAVVSVSGSGFAPAVQVDFDDPGNSEVCPGVRVELRAAGQAPVPLSDARILSATELRARLDAATAKGTWDLVVTDAGGRQATLPAALDVVGCPNSPPNQPCDDGEPCTTDDRCTGASRCAGTPVTAPDAPCDFPCTTGALVAGTCRAGACQPVPGACEPPPSCSSP